MSICLFFEVFLGASIASSLLRFMTDISTTVLAALSEEGKNTFTYYDQFLTDVFHACAPLFGEASYRQVYHDAASNPQWLAISLIANAEREGDGATRLWSLAACTKDSRVADQIRSHAIDESLHARSYIAVLRLVFPTAVDDKFYEQLLTLSPGYNFETSLVAVQGSPFAHDATVDDFIQMNIAEIRTLIHHLMQRPMLLGFCSRPKQKRLIKILDRLLMDETKHILYTAQLIDAYTATGNSSAIKALMLDRLQAFNEVTRHELAQRIFD